MIFKVPAESSDVSFDSKKTEILIKIDIKYVRSSDEKLPDISSITPKKRRLKKI
jgi:hypothetical protein